MVSYIFIFTSLQYICSRYSIHVHCLCIEIILQRKGPSKVWELFEKDIDGFAKCTLCHELYKHCNNTSNLSQHLYSKHEGEAVNILGPNLKQQQKKNKRSSRQNSEVQVEMYSKNSTKAIELNQKLIKFIAKDYQSFNIVNSKEFIDFVKTLDPRYKVPSYTQLKDVLIPEVYTNLVDNVKEKLKRCETVALTTDMWSSPASEGLITTTCHFIDETQLQSVVLDTEIVRGNHTAETIKMVYYNLIITFYIFKNNCFIS